MQKKNLLKVEIALVIIMSLGFSIMAIIFPLLLMGVPESVARNMKIVTIIGVLIFFAAISAIAQIDLLRKHITTN